MRTVFFVAPFLMDATLKFVQAAASVPGVRLVVLTQDDRSKVPPGALHYGVDNAMDPAKLVAACRDVMRHTGGAHRVIGILENAQETIADVREALGLPGMTRAVSERFRDKGVMKQVLRDAGLPCARYRRLHSADDGRAFAREVGFPIVLKPPAGAGCRATYQVNSSRDLKTALDETQPSPAREVLAEEFVKGEEYSFDTIVLDGQVVFHNILRYLPGPLDVTRNEWIQWCVLAPRDISGPEFDPIRKVGVEAVEALGLRTGMTHMEWFRRKNGSPVVSEVGARPPGAQFTSVMSYAYDRSMYHAWAHAVINERVEGPFVRQYAAGCAYLRGPGQGKVAAVENLERAQELVGPLVVEASLPRVGRAKATGYEGDGFVIVRHPDTDVVRRALATIIETVKVHYA
ncbi:MAG: ATP-grasp domain-containing protein [Deltaproteobacteria bacterium]|nr:ATP-grasp domain-containing protein [Deltaproteobacteria bacterium]